MPDLTARSDADCSAPDMGVGRVEVFPDRAAMGRAAARDVDAAMRKTIAERGAVRVVFAAAPSQGSTLDALASAPGIDWTRVTAFHMDEYVGLQPGHSSGFGNWLRRHIFDRLPFGAVHILPTTGDSATEAKRYAAVLNAAPIDIVVLGIGVNGHIAFNDPPVADFEDPVDVKLVELDSVCRQQQVDEGCFPDIASVPRTALTLTIPRLLRAGKLFVVAPGASKRAAVRAALHGPLTTKCPASVLRTHPDCRFYLDKESDPDDD
ncbi:MAG: glucosamine-6-phosphate deaminase [Roseovarius sp.]